MEPLAHPSPNFGPRRGGARPDMVVLHYTAMPSTGAALARLCDPATEVSCHYLVSESGTVLHLVAEEDRAWHAGAGAWGEVSDVNSRSIGIELANPGGAPFPAPQMTALEALLAGVVARWGIVPERVIGHSDVAPGRKSDPGPKFDWRRLACQGLSVWPGARDAAGASFAALARRAGYVWTAGDVTAEAAVLAAFRQRFRPAARGPLAIEDMERLADLAARWPVALDRNSASP
ncbi:N-acetylmuramoyl-L-alanine amidase [Maritimibacter sp. 55A14]|uniref:N-acetylmuramoyl-L-alanine amidase n=1 Tax=Maritimibacter sp. 55A14 TaxID=2174844 RepID=UPI001E399F7C|nr:N-acetylmuramoyl-L-alanine amidase [Maritimibacter sp. 55A14]